MPVVKLASAGYAVRRLTSRGRRIWARDGHAHVEYRPADDPTGEHGRALAAALLEHEDVHEVEVEPASGRLIVTYDDVWLDEDGLVALLEEAEARTDTDLGRFGGARSDHPADTEPVLRYAVQMAADVGAVGAAAAGRLLRWAPLPRHLDLGWVVSAARNFPQLREGLNERVGPETADLALGLVNATFHALGRNVTSPVVDLVHLALRSAEALARRNVWERREPQLCAAGSDGDATWMRAVERPVPLPPGEVERWSDRTLNASIGGLASSLAATNDLQRSVTAVLDTMPKAARLGREAFAAQLDRLLAHRGMVVMDAGALRLLDRVDTVVFDRDVLQEGAAPSPGARDVLAAAGRMGCHTLVVGEVEVDVEPDVVLAISDDLADVVESLQLEGRAVMLVHRRRTAAAPAADVAVGLTRAGAPAPWGAHVLAGDDLADVLLLLEAVGSARRVSRQSVRLAQTGTGIGAGAALGGLRRSARDRVVRVTDTVSMVSMASAARVARQLDRLPTTLRRDEVPWHALAPEDVLDRLGSGGDGLDAATAEARRVPPDPQRSRAELLRRTVADELFNPLTPILAAGAGLSLATGAVTDAAMVAGVVGLNATIGGLQRYRTERAIAALEATRHQRVTVVRAGERVTVAASDLVPGDVVELAAGEAVPADARILDATGVEVDEAALTGESLPVAKTAEPVDAPALADRRSMLYEGTSIAAGEVRAVVVAVGEDTEARRALASTVQEAAPETGVEARLRSITDTTIPLALGSGLGVAAAGFLRRMPTQQLVDASVGLAVAAVPEGLPLIATVAQLAAARRLSEKAVLVRNPRAVEALGRVDVVCADKTGTLTEGRIVLSAVSDGEREVAPDDADDRHHRVLLTARRATPIRDGGPLPHPTDQAIAEGTRSAGVRRENGGEFDVLDELPFEPGRSFHAVLAGTEGQRVLAVKGAPETVLERCTTWAGPDGDVTLDGDVRARLLEEGERMAAEGLRVLAIAERDGRGDAVGEDDVRELAFLGFLGLSDPVRPVAAAAVEDLRRAGVDVVMITGDHPATARGIAADLGLDDGIVITGPELDALTGPELDDVLPKVTVFARVTPAHKVRIVRALQAAGRVVAMTGDGANDAPAIRLADVGIALGKRATPAARDAADIIVTEERLEVIVEAIAEGRGLWESVRDAVAVLVGGNVGEIGFTLLGTLSGRRPPLNARQLLLVNLLTDVVPALAIAVRPPTDTSPETLLHEGPEESLGAELNRAIAWRATATTVGSTGAYLAARLTGTPTRARTVGLVALVGSQLGQTLTAGATDRRVVAGVFGSGAVLAAAVNTPGLSRLVGCRPLGPVGWAIGLAGASAGTAVSVVGPRVERLLRRN